MDDAVRKNAETCPRCESRSIKCLGFELNENKVGFLKPLEYFCTECGLVWLNFTAGQLFGESSMELQKLVDAWDEFLTSKKEDSIKQ